MGKWQNSQSILRFRALLTADRWIWPGFLSFLLSLWGGVVFLQLRRGNWEVMLIALVVAGLACAGEYMEVQCWRRSAQGWNFSPRFVFPSMIIVLAPFVVSYPTLKIYFLGDDFAYIHLFHNASFPQLLSLFYTDLSQGMWGRTIEELRPLYGIFYTVLYSVWGLSPLGYHLAAIVLHVLNSWLVFKIVNRVFGGHSWRAIFAGSLFAVLPIHSEIISWVSGALSDGPATVLYLCTFLCFVCFRQTGQNYYLVLSTLAFAACLLTKEIAITLPATLVAYDCFRAGWEEPVITSGEHGGARVHWGQVIRTYAPFAVLISAYFGLRWIAFGNFLREDQWYGTRTTSAFFQQLSFWATSIGRIHALNLYQAWLSFGISVLGCALGLYASWTVLLLRNDSARRRSAGAFIYFGLVWTLIASAPLLLAPFGPGPRHLYLAAAGQCIAISLLAFPLLEKAGKEATCLRLLGAIFLVAVSAYQLRIENAEWLRWGDRSSRETAELTSALMDLPEQSLVVIDFPGWNWILPYSLQEPFRSRDSYSRIRIIESPERYCCPTAQWWRKTRRVLAIELSGPANELREIHLLAWDEESSSFHKKRRIVSRSQLQVSVTQSLGRPFDIATSIGQTEADSLVQTLARLVSDGS